MTNFKTLKQTLIQLFNAHPHSVGETYPQHFQFACWTGIRLVFAGAACIIHSIFPFVFSHTASNTIDTIKNEMAERKNKTYE